MNILAMTPVALLHFLTLTIQHDLTDDETRAAVRLACGGKGRVGVGLAEVEQAISDVLAARMAHVA